MSTTTTDAPKLAITNANTAGDILRAAANDKDLQNDLFNGLSAIAANKSLLGSKTFWATFLTPLVTWIVGYFALGIDGTTIGAIASGLGFLVAAGMRYITKTPVASVLPTAKA